MIEYKKAAYGMMQSKIEQEAILKVTIRKL